MVDRGPGIPGRRRLDDEAQLTDRADAVRAHGREGRTDRRRLALGRRVPAPWKDTTIKWTLTANDGGGTRVHFDHDDWATDEGMFAMTAYTWGQLLGVLKNYLEAGVSQPMFVKAPASASTTDSPNQRQPPA